MGLLQIDTIQVTARSPYLVLWSRLGNYECGWLDELLAEGKLFEYWAHAMCFLPIEDYPLHRRPMLDAIAGSKWPGRGVAHWLSEHQDVVERVMSRLRENGSVRSADFEDQAGPRRGGWWDWKDEKTALECLLLTGEVMVAERRNFQRVYASAGRVLPGWDTVALPSSDEVRRTLALRAVLALGIAHVAWVPDYFRQRKTGMPALLSALAAEGALVPIALDGLDGPAYIHPDRLPQLDEAASRDRPPGPTTFLSPFDPVIWDRQRARDLFGFDYLMEVYTPAAKRRYGYFTLPILHRGHLVGRLDPKAHRAKGVFEVRALHLEAGVAIDEELVTELSAALRRLASWHNTPDLVMGPSDPPELAAQLRAAL
jgi:uncharacterized protein YcaQ